MRLPRVEGWRLGGDRAERQPLFNRGVGRLARDVREIVVRHFEQVRLRW